MSKSERQRFVAGAIAIIEQNGGQKSPEGSYHAYTLDTKYGPLGLNVDLDHRGPGPGTIFTRFEYPHLAHQTQCNPYTGKWNHHYLTNNLSAEDALSDFECQLNSVQLTSLKDFTSATSLLPRVVAETVIGERLSKMHDPPYTVDGFDQEQGEKWFAAHVERRTIFLYDNNKRVRKLLLGDTSRDMLYAFVEHWLDAYLHNPPDYRKKCPIVRESMLV